MNLKHIGEELWEFIGNKQTITYEPWPSFESDKTKDDVVTIVIQINGKIRDKVEVEIGLAKEELEKIALGREKIQFYLNNQSPKKVIVVPNKLVSIVL